MDDNDQQQTPAEGTEASGDTQAPAKDQPSLQDALKPLADTISAGFDEVNRKIANQAPTPQEDVQTPAPDPTDEINDANFWEKGVTKSTKSIAEKAAETAVKKYHELHVKPKQDADDQVNAARLDRDIETARKTIESLPNYAEMKDDIEKTISRVADKSLLAAASTWEGAYDINQGRRQRASYESKHAGGLPPSDVSVSREGSSTTLTEGQIAAAAKMGISKESLEKSNKAYHQDGRKLKVV